jgi:hypothetical protein
MTREGSRRVVMTKENLLDISGLYSDIRSNFSFESACLFVLVKNNGVPSPYWVILGKALNNLIFVLLFSAVVTSVVSIYCNMYQSTPINGMVVH